MTQKLTRSKQRIRAVLIAIVILLAFTTLVSAQSSITVRDFSVDAGGAVSRGGRYVLTGVIGQPDAATSSGGAFTVQGGLLDPEPWRVWAPIIEDK